MEMGQRVSLHRGTFGAGGWLWYIAGILLASGVVGLGQAALKADAEKAGVGAIALGVGSLLAIVPLLRWRQTVEVFEHGLVWTRLYGVVKVARADIQNVKWTRHISKQGQHDEVEVALRDGKSYSMVGLDQAEQLSSMLRAAQPNAAPGPAQTSSAGAKAQGWTPGAWKPPGT